MTNRVAEKSTPTVHWRHTCCRGVLDNDTYTAVLSVHDKYSSGLNHTYNKVYNSTQIYLNLQRNIFTMERNILVHA